MSAAASSLTKEGLAEQARHVLQALLADATSGGATYLSAMRERFGRSSLVPVEEQIAFLEKFGYLLVNRTNNTLTLTRDGELVANGDKLGDLTGDAAHFFDARLKSSGRAIGPVRPRKATGEVIDDRYRKLGQIGSGGVGTVFRATHLATDRPVALKIIRDVFVYFTELQRKELVRRLDDVVKQTSRLVHPNVAQVMDANTTREHPYVVSQLAPSGSLRRILSVDEPIAASRVVAYFTQMCHALRSAHQLGITHRGLKPENVLIDLYGNLQVSDFGLSRIVERDAGVINQVFVGMGSVAYMAPEQFADPRCADARSDIYGLGIILYEMCTRRLPGRRSPMPSEVNRELPKGLDDVFDQMTQDAPEDRFGSVQEVLDALYASSGVEQLLDRRRAVLFAESPSLDLPLDGDEVEEGGQPYEAAGQPVLAAAAPLTLDSPAPIIDPVVTSPTPAPLPRVIDRTEQVRVEPARPLTPPVAITEDRMPAPSVPGHFVDPADRETPPPRAEPRPAAERPARSPIVDDDFDDVGGGVQIMESTGVIQPPFPDEDETGGATDDLFDEQPRLPGSDPRKSRGAMRRPMATSPGPGPGPAPLPPRKPLGGK